MNNELLDQELSMDELGNVNGGFLLILLFGCRKEKPEATNTQNNNGESNESWLSIGSKSAIRQSGSNHKHPIYGSGNGAGNVKENTSGEGCTGIPSF